MTKHHRTQGRKIILNIKRGKISPFESATIRQKTSQKSILAIILLVHRNFTVFPLGNLNILIMLVNMSKSN